MTSDAALIMALNHIANLVEVQDKDLPAETTGTAEARSSCSFAAAPRGGGARLESRERARMRTVATRGPGLSRPGPSAGA